MIAITVAELAAVVGAELIGPGEVDRLITAVSADSRSVPPGALFVALAGERADGHDFVTGVVRAGAAAALTAHPVEDALCLVVADPLDALGRIARHLVDVRAPAGLAVVGITGSQGKTSTKDLLAQILETAGPTVAPVGNLNNELGLPLTVARIDEETEFLVAEMGARGIGHIARLCSIAPPQIGVVLNVGHAHVGEFGGQAAIAQAKGELVESVPATGWAVLNREDQLVWAMRSRTRASVLSFGVAPPDGNGPAVWATEVAPEPTGAYGFRLHVRAPGSSGSARVRLQGVGRHQVANALAAAAAAAALGQAPDVVAAALSGATARSRWRMELTATAAGALVVNDSYNANPESMRAALETAMELGRARGGRVWAVLGDMLELGAEAEAAHAAIGEYAADAGVDRLLGIGPLGAVLASAAGAAGLVGARRVASAGEALEAVLADLQPADVVLVKASRGLALNTVADDIVARAQRTTTGTRNEAT